MRKIQRTTLLAAALACLCQQEATAATCTVTPAMKNATVAIPYSGDCRNGLAHGKGKYTVTFGAANENTREFAGEFAEGKLNGRATVTTTSPRGITKAEGTYASNELHGSYRMVLPDGREATLEYRSGKIVSGINQGVRNGVPFASRWDNGRQVTLCLGDRSNEFNCTPAERAVLLEGAAQPPTFKSLVEPTTTRLTADSDEVNAVATTTYGKSFPPLGGTRLGDGPRAMGKLIADLQRQGYLVHSGSLTSGSFQELLSGGFLAINEGQLVMAIPASRTNRIALIKRSEAWSPVNLPVEEVFLGALKNRFSISSIVDSYSARLTKGALEWGVTKAGRPVPSEECYRENIQEAGFANAAFGKLLGGDTFPRTASDFIGLHPISARLDTDGKPYCALYVHVQMYVRESPVGRQLERYDMSVTDVASLYEDHRVIAKAQKDFAEKERQRALQSSPLPKF